MNFDWKLTDHQLIIEHEDGMTEYIYIEFLESFAIKENRLFTTKDIYKDGEMMGTETLAITFDDYLKSLNKFEISLFLNARRYGLDN